MTRPHPSRDPAPDPARSKVRVVCYGLGPIGRAAARLALTRKSIKVVGAVDVDPAIVGRDLGLVAGRAEPCLVDITDDPEKLLAEKEVDVVVHATGSRLEGVYDQLAGIVDASVNVVSSCEELLFPWLANPEKAGYLSELARATGASVLGTGVNPGFVLDTLALCLSGVMTELQAVRAVRVVDAATRRGPLVRKVGAGMTVERFRALAGEKRIGHVGLVESLALVADATGLGAASGGLDIQENLDPVVADRRHVVGDVTVEPGQVAGIHHVAIGTVGNREVIHLDLKMYVGAPDPHDRVTLQGTPAIDARIEGGVAGDEATAAMLVNLVPVLHRAPPGLLTMADVPIPRFTG